MTPLTSSILFSLNAANPSTNWVFSPASYLEAMSNLAVCLKDRNLAELLAAAPDIERPQSIGLDTYNCLLYADKYRAALVESVIETLRARGTDLKSFSGLEVVDMVNSLVREKTHGKIDNLISPDDISEFTSFIILNCVYFKQKWVDPFEEGWRAEPFNGATKVSQVKYLRNKIIGRRYYEGPGYDIVELLYRESDVACYLIVPTTGSVFDVFNRATEVFGHIADVKAALDVDLTVPPFKVETTIDLIPATKAAGVTRIFDQTQDWSLVDLEKVAPGSLMWVEFIRQKASLDFTKDGTEAAAATAIGIGCASGCMIWQEPPPVKIIRADKPFVYVLANRTAPDKPLFVGVVNEVPDAPADMPHHSINEIAAIYDLVRRKRESSMLIE